MITTIHRTSSREKAYNIANNYEGYNSAIKERLKQSIEVAIHYKRISELPEAQITLGEKYRVTGKIKYSRGRGVCGERNNWVDIFVEITWKETKAIKAIKARWFKPSEMHYTDRFLWIPSDAFSFDFSNEVEEEIIDCAYKNTKA